MLGFMGRSIQMNVGAKYVYWLYGLGALFGGATTAVFQPPSPYIAPQVGADSVIAAYLTFIALMNPQQTFFVFFFPVKAWVAICCLGFYSLLTDPNKKFFAGITAGVTVHQMMRARFI
jgi:membrane associated rhomboid family serine protease